MCDVRHYCQIDNVARMLTDMAEAQKTGGVPQFSQRHRMALALETASMSREEMATELGVHRNTINNWMKGAVQPPRSALIAWALRTGVPFDWLLTGRIDYDNGPDQDTRMARCIRGPWFREAYGDELTELVAS